MCKYIKITKKKTNIKYIKIYSISQRKSQVFRSQVKKSTFLVSGKSQNALNHVLIADSESTQKIMQTGTGIIDFDAFCVELRPFY